MNPEPCHLLLVLIVAASVSVARGDDAPPKTAQSPKVRTLEVRVGRDKQFLPSDPEQKREFEQFYRSLEEQAKLCVVPFQRHLEAQAHFIGKVCQFDEARRADLAEQCHAIAQAALDRLCEAIFARHHHGNVVVVVDGVERVIPSGVNEPFLASPREIAQWAIYSAIVNGLSADERVRLDDQREQSERQAREVEVLGKIALLDELFLLSAEQRGQFFQLLSKKWTDGWRQRRPAYQILFWGGKQAVPTSDCAGIGGPFNIPAVEVTARLRPAQVPIFDGFYKSNTTRTGGANSTSAVFAGAAYAPTDEQLLPILIDDVSVASGLSDEQRSKLQLAGALAIERRRAAAREQPVAPIEQRPNALDVDIVSFSTMLAEERSPFFKALHSTLTSTQRTRLAEARAERQRFHQRAALADVIHKVSERAVLTTAQREQLEAFIVARLDDMPEADPALGLRLGQLHRIIAIRPTGLEESADFRALFDDFQRPLEIEAWMLLEQDLATQKARRDVPEAMQRQRAAGLNMF